MNQKDIIMIVNKNIVNINVLKHSFLRMIFANYVQNNVSRATIKVIKIVLLVMQAVFSKILHVLVNAILLIFR